MLFVSNAVYRFRSNTRTVLIMLRISRDPM